MLTLKQATELINAGITPAPRIMRWRGVYYGMSLHTTGACPRFYYSNLHGTAYVDGSDGGSYVEPPGYYGPEYQVLFDQFLLSRHPKETPQARNWRYSQYKPYTRDPFLRIMEVVGGAIFQDSNYSLTLEKKEDHEYVWGDNFSGFDLIQYFAWAINCIFEDPNGYFLRIPKKPYYETGDVPEPEVWFIPSKDIEYLDKTDFIFCRDGYKWWVNTTTIIRYKKAEPGLVTQWILADPEGYYAHMLGYLPIDVAGGVWNNQGFFDSWLVKAKAAADDFISCKSAEQFVDKEASHPFIIQAQEDCPECNGTGRLQQTCQECDGGMELVTCSKCRGTGGASQNPGDRMLVPREYMSEDLVKLVSPDVSINKHHREKNKEVFALILDALCLLRIDEAQSGLAKTIDQERLYQFVSKMSNDIFGRLIYNSVRDIIAYRNVTVVNGETRPAIYNFILVKPSQYRIKTSSDLLQDYNMASMAKVPDFIRVRLLDDFVDKIFGGDEKVKRKSSLIGQMDPISTYTQADKIDLLTNGGIQQKDFQFSLRLPTMLDQIVREKGTAWFLEAQYETVLVEVTRIFALVYEPYTAPATPPGSSQPKPQPQQQQISYE